MTGVLSGLLVVAGAVGAFVALGAAMRAMGRGEVDRAYPVRPVPPRRPRTDLDSDPIWATTPMEPAESEAEMYAMRGLRARYGAAHEHLYNEAIALGLSTDTTPPEQGRLAEDTTWGGDRG